MQSVERGKNMAAPEGLIYVPTAQRCQPVWWAQKSKTFDASFVKSNVAMNKGCVWFYTANKSFTSLISV